jgi:putative DNA primase/helicase
MALAEAALDLALAQPVLPLEPAGKRPLGGLGLRHASRAPEIVRGWWQQWPQANIGMRCDGLCVVDVDGAAGERSLLGLQRLYGRLPASRGQQTGRGRHLLYATEVELGNSTNPLGRPDGIDLRGGSRGYIVAPPSVHANGHVYRWTDERPPALLPPGWVERLARVRVEPREIEAVHLLGLDTETAYGRRALEGELERLLQACDGERNDVLNRAAFRLAQLVAGNQLPLARVEREAFEVALELGLDASESRDTIKSAVAAGLRFPRSPRARAHARETHTHAKG